MAKHVLALFRGVAGVLAGVASPVILGTIPTWVIVGLSAVLGFIGYFGDKVSDWIFVPTKPYRRWIVVGIVAAGVITWEGWPWPRIQALLASNVGNSADPASPAFKCKWYNFTFVELEVYEYPETTNDSARFQFMVHSIQSEYKYQTVRIKGVGTYPINLPFERVLVERRGIVLDMRAIDPVSYAPNGWKWPVFTHACANPDAWGEGIREAPLSNGVIKCALRYKIECGD